MAVINLIAIVLISHHYKLNNKIIIFIHATKFILTENNKFFISYILSVYLKVTSSFWNKYLNLEELKNTTLFNNCFKNCNVFILEVNIICNFMLNMFTTGEFY